MRRYAVACLLVTFAGAPGLVFASDPVSTPAAANQAPYEDRLIDGGTLKPDVSDDRSEYDGSGWPRAIRVEAVKTVLRRTREGGKESEREDGGLLGMFLETPNFGAFTFDGVFRTDGQSSGSLWQRGLPVEGGWRVNNGLGVINTPGIELTRTQPRFFLPSTAVAGLSTEWRDPQGTLAVAGGGEPGTFDGIRLPTFDRLGGSVSTAGLQLSPSRGWRTGIQLNNANAVPLGFGPSASAERISATSIFSGISWEDATHRVQANVLASERRDGDFNGTHFGIWVDANIVDGRIGHSFGAFRMERDLTWGNQLISSDLQGGYYRANYWTRQWLFDGGVDHVSSVSGNGTDVTFATASVRHQYSRDIGLGAGVNVRQASDTAYSAFTFVDRATALGLTRAQIDYAQELPQRDLQLTIDQSWSMPAAQRLSTSLILGRFTDANGTSSRRYGAGLVGGFDLTNALSIDGNANWTTSSGPGRPSNTYANIGLSWQIVRNLRLSAVYYENHTDAAQPLTVQSPIQQPFVIQTFNDRGFFLTLRFDASAGRAYAPLGGRAGDGAGSVTGVVFLDANDDQRFNAGEQGAANVSVILNGRFVTRTDSSGRFEFPSVIEGRHLITVVPDNLPLPWVVKNDGRTELSVSVRSSTQLEIAAQRIR